MIHKFVYFVTALVLMPFSTMMAIRFSVQNPNPVAIDNAPVVVNLSDLRGFVVPEQGLVLTLKGKKTEVQLDDTNRDGKPDELVFLVNLKAGEKAEVKIGKASKRKHSGKNKGLMSGQADRVFASLILKDDAGNWHHKDEVSSDKNDMYNRLHHHGVAFESEKMAYRIYFDNKSTIDLYGKKSYRLELKDTWWYPTDKQLAEGYGDDILLVSGWVGIGTLKGWTSNKMQHIEKFGKRTHRIIARGPLRVMVESEVEGWDYEGKLSTVSVRYILYAGKRDVVAEVRSNNDLQAIATGVQQIGGGDMLSSNTLVGSWGSWHPQPDTVKYAKETVGLGLYLPKAAGGQQLTDGVNNLIVMPVKKDQVLRYYFTVVAAKENEQTIQNAGLFFEYLNTWKQGLEPVVVKL